MKLRDAQYVLLYYGRYMTLNETAAYKHLHATMKATKGRSDTLAQQEAKDHITLSKLLTDDPEIARLAKDGYEIFAERTAERILTERKDGVFLNFCPRCHELARTPKARQCRFCGLDWHPVNQATRD